MGNGKDVDYDVVIPALKKIEQIIENLKYTGEVLKKEGEIAQNTLKDPIGHKDSQAVIDLGIKVKKAVNTGEERVREKIKYFQDEADVANSLAESR